MESHVALEEVKWHAKSPEEAAGLLDTDIDKGLSSEEAKRRLGIYGPNELEVGKPASPIKIFLKQFANILVGILILATLLSALLGEIIDAAVIMIIVFFIAVLGFVQEYKAEKAIEELKKLLTPSFVVVRDGVELEVSSREVVPGDLAVLREGDKVVADIRLSEVFNLRVDESPLTGESFPVEKKTDKLPPNVALAERANMVFAGTSVVGGRGRGIVVATGSKTELGKIASATAVIEAEKTPLELKMNEVGKKFGLIALSVIFTLAVIELIQEALFAEITLSTLVNILLFGVALAVAAIPEALPAIVTASLAVGMRIMARNNALVRRLPAVETLGATQVICFDKTGTLTKGEMTVRKIATLDTVYELSGVGYSPEGEVSPRDNSPALRLLMTASILCNDSNLVQRNGGWRVVGDPTEGALIVAAYKTGVDVQKIREKNPRVDEIPFSAERKYMITVNKMEGDGYYAFLKGAPEIVLKMCSRFADRDCGEHDLTEVERGKITQLSSSMASEALRILAVAYKRVDKPKADSSGGYTLLGLVGMMDPPRPEAIEAVKAAKMAGMKPVMITGDHKLTAVAVAREAGIMDDDGLVLEGWELEGMGDDQLYEKVEEINVYARISPIDKLRIVNAWRSRGYVVAMTGDGVNDAPALKKADIGVAMGVRGTEVAKEASDMVLADDNFATIVKAIELGRWIYDNIKKYLAYLLEANLVEIAVITISSIFILRFMGFSGEEILPLLPVHILYINLATDGLPAIALGFSPADPDIMQRPPRRKEESIFTREVRLFIIRALLVETPILLLGFYSALDMGIEHARSRLFLMFIFIELAVALSCRSLKYTIVDAKPHKWLILSILWETLLIAVLVLIPWTRDALHIVIPTQEDIAWITGGFLAVLASMEALKKLLF